MKIKTSELTGAALDWAVAKCEGLLAPDGIRLSEEYCDSLGHNQDGDFTTDWAQGGPIIEREGINIRAIRKEGHSLDGKWLAAYDHGNTGTMVEWVKRTDFPRHYLAGPTPLVAAMRCYVASKLGDTVDIPEELK
jgi:hypothetical protein